MKREGQIKIESENMLPIIKKWLYSDKDIFLREIVANACDAIKKYKSLCGIGEAEDDGQTPRIDVVVDKEAGTITVSDTGIGMTEDEVEKYITQIAFSGAEEFIEKYKDKTDAESGIIGHFGLGFYSAYMVSDNVEIETLSFQKDAKPVHWSSDGGSTYEIEEGTRVSRGTSIIMHITENEKEFLDEFKIQELLRKYCHFMPYEIYLNYQQKLEKHKAEEAEKKKSEESENITNEDDFTISPVNNTTPLWLKAPKDCTDEEYEDFYREVFMDYNPPLFWIHLNVDYPFNLKGILYFPKQTDKLQVMPGEIKLFANQVYIADNIKEVLPEFLMLLKGVIDCPDLPLNVSRSFLQNDGEVAKISKHITKKVADKLVSVFKNDRESYESYWEDIAPFIKFGCIKDEKFYEKVKDIILFKSINGDYKTLSTLDKQDGNKVYYATDENTQAQYIKMFRDNQLDAVLLGHSIDQHFISFLEYKETDLHFARIDSEIGDALKNKNNTESDTGELIEAVKKALDMGDLEIKAEALKSDKTPAVILVNEYERRMNDMSHLYGGMFGATPKAKEILLLNTENVAVKKLLSMDEDKRKIVCRYIYDLAVIGQRTLTANELESFIAKSVEILEML